MFSANSSAPIIYHGFEVSDGTTPISRAHLDEKRLPSENVWFVAVDVITSNFALVAAPKQMQPEVTAIRERSLSDADVERVGHIYALLADEDAALAETGLDEYARLLDHELVDTPSALPTVDE